MAQDLVYYFDKITHEKIELGEIQTGFNMCFTIDGTKDSAKVIVWTYNRNVIQPNTIIYHAKTNTWWVVSHDKVDRYTNENETFVYTHELTLNGAFELLNARDLTDCGFNQNTYTIEDFINRLFALSNFEFPVEIETNGNIYLYDIVDYIKTYENYTLLSALREFLDGYNLVGKLSFTTTNNVITGAKLSLISKAGNVNQVANENIFIDNKENRNIDKNSYGTIVVSNAENVISTRAKTYPTKGTAKLSAENSANITNTNATIRLPSNINKINWIKVINPFYLVIQVRGNYTDTYDICVSADNDYLMSYRYNNIAQQIKNSYGNEIYEKLMEVKNFVLDTYKKGQTTTLYSGWSYNPINRTFIAPTNNEDFYFPKIAYNTSTTEIFTGEFLLAEKQVRDGINQPNRCLYYTRGDNKISGFDWFSTNYSATNKIRIFSLKSSDLRSDTYDRGQRLVEESFEGNIDLDIYFTTFSSDTYYGNNYSIFTTTFIINYVPMSDLKIKTDNTGYDKDIHLYNQNGKLTDSVALSKLINSYSKEIQSDNITKYGNYYDIDSIPQIGTIVNFDSGDYVINNVSMDISQNENFEYYFACEFSLSKFVATKSLMTNPNSNIRDYGIPQNNNVVRKQVYRDFYELDKTFDPNTDTEKYLGLDKILNIYENVSNFAEHIAFIKMTYEDNYGGAERNDYYYQLDTTTYILKKALYEIVDFRDNNIIGYDSQNVWSGFDITRVFTGMTDLISTPISYVDDNGKAEGIEICFATLEQATEVYGEYEQRKAQQYPSQYAQFKTSLYNYSVFIDKEIYVGTQAEDTYIFSGTAMLTGFKISVDITSILPSTNIPLSELSARDIVVSKIVGGEEIEPTLTEIRKDNNTYILDLYFESGDLGQFYLVNCNIVRNYISNGVLQNNDFIIREPNYYKDAIEVPFFEYACQIDDSENVLVGDDVLENKDSDIGYFYQWFLAPKGVANNNNFLGLDLPNIGERTPTGRVFENGCDLAYNSNNTEISILIWNGGIFDPVTNEVRYYGIKKYNKLDLENNDLVVIRVAKSSLERKLMFVVKNPSDFEISQDSRLLYLKINHYRLN